MINLKHCNHSDIVDILAQGIDNEHMESASDSYILSFKMNISCIPLNSDLIENIQYIHVILNDITEDGIPSFKIVIGSSEFIIYTLPQKVDMLVRQLIRNKTKYYANM